MGKSKFTKDDSIALTVTLSVSIVMLLFSLWYTLDMNQTFRPSFVEVEFGEFQTGTLAEYSEVKEEEVATRPNPSEVKTEEPVEEVPKPEEQPVNPTEEVTKPVDLPDEVEEVIEEPVKTPETEVVDPTKKTAEEVQEKVEVPPVAKEDLSTNEGAEESGDIKGNRGETNADAGTGSDDEKSAPYELKWEGNLEREPMVQPLPNNTANAEGVISVRFQVKPDGSVGLIIPLKKMNPELEKEVQRTLKSWKFSRLPSGVPQKAQWGTITFRFVFG
ncbi:energy transducer TonB [Balneola vulgaris]|uniref:energy transducer TonB n=1 Tax=Balneola vulgaris TaxID=287535 RepID=UPI0003691522|nr:energy transducer TonB [Balneola vulgaris]